MILCVFTLTLGVFAQEPFVPGILQVPFDDDPTAEIVACSNAFALQTMAKMIEAKKEAPEENIVFSPFNLFRMLYLLHEGSSGASKAQLAQCLDLDAYTGVTPETLYQLLVDEGLKASQSGLDLGSAMAIWTDVKYPPTERIQSLAREKFLGLVTSFDFFDSAETLSISLSEKASSSVALLRAFPFMEKPD